MSTWNRTFPKRTFDLTYVPREMAGGVLVTDYILDEAGANILDEASDPLLSEIYCAGTGETEGMHYPKRVFDLTYSVRDHE